MRGVCEVPLARLLSTEQKLGMWNIHVEWCRAVSFSVLQQERGTCGTGKVRKTCVFGNSKQKTRKLNGECLFRKG